MADAAVKYPLLIEIGCEDLPPGAQRRIQQAGEALLKDILKEKRIDYGKISIMTSPRRIALKILSVSSLQKGITEKIKGPPAAVALKDGKPSPAALGFAKKMGVAFKELSMEDTGRGKYLFYICQRKGLPVREMIPSILEEFLLNLNLGERMAWPGGKIKFPRPVRWLTVKMGSRAVIFQFGNIKSSGYTKGHYLFADRKVQIRDIEKYESILEKNYVIADHEKRQNLLVASLDRPLNHTMGYIVKNERLLEEVNNSLEYPTGIKGSFPEKYLKLPRIIIEACLVYHQKYFPVEDSKGNLLNYFVAARDGISEYIENIRRGYEKVLIARLEDAYFFLKKDREKSLEKHLPRLKGIDFSRGLGTLYDKVKRIVWLADKITAMIGFSESEKKNIERGGLLCKADLGTHIVGEFPELESAAGAVYAEMDGENKTVCEIVRQHSFPVDFKDEIPSLDGAAAVGIADRIDTITGNIGKGARASGSQDPFGLRRCCRGMLRITIEKEWFIDLSRVLQLSIKRYNSGRKVINPEAAAEIREFIESILYQMLEEKFPYDTSRCVMSRGELNPAAVFRKAAAMEKIRQGKGFDSLVAAFKRINNILRQAEEKKIKIPGKYDGRKLRDKYERQISGLLRDSEKKVRNSIDKHNFEDALKVLISLRKPIDGFFDNVLVMDPDESVKKNRLALLKNILDLFSPAGDISKLELKNTDA